MIRHCRFLANCGKNNVPDQQVNEEQRYPVEALKKSLRPLTGAGMTHIRHFPLADMH
ncbi:MAG: hypothetical protein KJ804_17985 [Proteobacteria bacterium]|nr:hypothetical protein [Pseudomonadota bacterium]MBU1060199.1 hypothetical protein [Pseudomonadota bacterium]